MNKKSKVATLLLASILTSTLVPSISIAEKTKIENTIKPKSFENWEDSYVYDGSFSVVGSISDTTAIISGIVGVITGSPIAGIVGLIKEDLK